MALTERRYVLAAKLPEALRKRFSDYSGLLLQLLYNREFLTTKTTEAELEALLNPDFKRGLHDPLLIPDMKQAVARIIKAVDGKEQISVYGDYDADGVPGTAILIETLERLGARVDSIIPARESDGCSNAGWANVVRSNRR